MDNRERVLTALSHKQPDKTPVSIGTEIVDGFSRYAKDKYEEYLGVEKYPLLVTSRGMQTAAMPEWFLKKIGSEFRPVRMIDAFTDKTIYHEDGSFTDGFGIYWKKSELYFDQIHGPLYGPNATLEQIKNLPWIDTYDKSKVAGMREEALRLKAEGYIVVADMMSFGTFEHSLWLRGWEDFLVSFYEDPVFAEALLERTTQGAIELFDNMLSEIGDVIDIVSHGDDLGMQDRSLISPEIYNKYIKKYHKKLIDFIKTKTKAKLFFHTCGSVHSLIPGLIEAGVDILNPVQTTAHNMDPATLKRDFGKDICFWGGIDTQDILQKGTKHQMREHIKELIDVLGKDGGYVLAPAHNIQPSIPPERIEYMIECINELR